MSSHDADEENRDDLEVVDLTEHIGNQILPPNLSHTNFHIGNENSNDSRDQNQMEVDEAHGAETAPVIRAATETNETGQEDAPRGMADSDMGWLDVSCISYHSSNLHSALTRVARITTRITTTVLMMIWILTTPLTTIHFPTM